MSGFVIAPEDQATVPVVGSDSVYPVRRVYCIGRNYAAHTVEMGGDPDREAPFFFQKNPQNLSASGEFPYPSKTENVHHEVELAVALKSGGSNLSLEASQACVYGLAVAIDMTRRDLQQQAKDKSRPWEVAKAFEFSAPCGAIVPLEEGEVVNDGHIELKVNDEVRQTGNLNQMIWKVPEMIQVLSEYYTLAAGDVILTGTPSGVAAVEPGDVLHATIESVGELRVKVVG